jgi:hypothetical protein
VPLNYSLLDELLLWLYCSLCFSITSAAAGFVVFVVDLQATRLRGV